jgi:predicted lipoprotein with Yx(FWY)xxD motif
MTKIAIGTPAAALVAALALAAAGCGSSSSSTNSVSSSGHSRYGGGSGTTSSASSTSASGAAPAPAVTVSAKTSKLGTILAAGPAHKTVYIFEGDSGSTSACSGACAAVWPPVTGSASAGAGAMAADLGTITRSDGTKQVTYKGHPLYYFARDGDKGDAYGQGIKSFGASWYVLAPSGSKVDNS